MYLYTIRIYYLYMHFCRIWSSFNVYAILQSLDCAPAIVTQNTNTQGVCFAPLFCGCVCRTWIGRWKQSAQTLIWQTLLPSRIQLKPNRKAFELILILQLFTKLCRDKVSELSLMWDSSRYSQRGESVTGRGEVQNICECVAHCTYECVMNAHMNESYMNESYTHQCVGTGEGDFL